MREIKFRQPRFGAKGDFIDWFYWGFINGGFVSPLRFDRPNYQFTGKLDKNGKEIYEGDILKDDSSDVLVVRFGKLPLDKSGDCVCTYPAFYCEDKGGLGYAPVHECREIGNWMEVIGNIHENPEILERQSNG